MTIGICGAGTMGSGIAVAVLQAGMRCVLYDIQDDYTKRGLAFVEKQLRTAVSKGKMSEERATQALDSLRCTVNLADLADCDFVIEAIVERKDIKDELFANLEAIIKPSAILGTNTSSIAISSLARSLKNPDRFIGIHFFNPAHIMKLVEIIAGPHTSDACMKETLAFVKALSKSPAVAKDVPGFIVNRVARNYYNESQRIVMESAATHTQVDAIMRANGFKMGPFELMDLIGVDVNLEVTKSMYAQYFYEPRFQPSLLQQQMVDAGLHGRKSGRGFYDYSEKPST